MITPTTPTRRQDGPRHHTERYRLVEWRNPGQPKSTAEYELYDDQTDPNETRNHASSADHG